MFKDPATTLKFGYLWFFKQPSKDDFAKSIIKLLYSTETLLNEYLEAEGLTADDVGYRSDSAIALLQHNKDYSQYQKDAVDYEKYPHFQFDRASDPKAFEANVDDKLPHIPATKRYEHCLVRPNPTLNTAWLCETIFQKLKNKANVEFQFDTFVNGYEIGKDGKVKSVTINAETQRERQQIADLFVVCTGP